MITIQPKQVHCSLSVSSKRHWLLWNLLTHVSDSVLSWLYKFNLIIFTVIVWAKIWLHEDWEDKGKGKNKKDTHWWWSCENKKQTYGTCISIFIVSFSWLIGHVWLMCILEHPSAYKHVKGKGKNKKDTHWSWSCENKKQTYGTCISIFIVSFSWLIGHVWLMCILEHPSAYKHVKILRGPPGLFPIPLPVIIIIRNNMLFF